jgi:hypothetical protein
MYLTRNQAYRKVPRVRIPPSPPRMRLKASKEVQEISKKPRRSTVYGAFLFFNVRQGALCQDPSYEKLCLASVEGAPYKGTAMPSCASHNLSCLGRSSSESEVRNCLSWLPRSFGFWRIFSFIASVACMHECVAVALSRLRHAALPLTCSHACIRCIIFVARTVPGSVDDHSGSTQQQDS